MRVIIQRVKKSVVNIEQSEKREIGPGMLVLVGIEEEDNDKDIDWLTGKILRLRIFGDEKGLMNLSVEDIKGELMVISQFTLHASVKKGNRPSFIKASKPEKAVPLYNSFIEKLRKSGLIVQSGKFGANMEINLVNDGPVTIFIDSKNKV